MFGVLWLLFWQFTGCAITTALPIKRNVIQSLWISSVLGNLLAAWSPIPFAFIFDFTIKAHILAFMTGICLVLPLIIYIRKIKAHYFFSETEKTAPAFLIYFFALFILFFCLLLSHTLQSVNGELRTGQCTYGDFSMHLSFITSMAEQKSFPFLYNLLPDTKLCYPFLCDSISASLYLLGTPLRWAYMLPMLFAFSQVICGVWFLAEEISGPRTAALAGILFFFNGGFGIFYFFGKYRFADIFTAFYKTPTNLAGEGVLWVNVIADMLLPQRATLFGYAALFCCIFLLYRAVFTREHSCWLPAGIICGLLPMIHTHSYLALGLTALCWMITDLRDRRQNLKQWFLDWCCFGLPAVMIALPQLIIWTMQSVGGNSSFLRLHFDWVNGGKENIFIFWLKNIGIVLPVSVWAFFTTSKEKRILWFPPILIFAICEFVVFQPNVYDNNKLLYVGYLFACILCAEHILCNLQPKKRSVQAMLLALFLLLSTNAAVLTIIREAVSGTNRYSYELFSADEQRAAEYIRSNTSPDDLFLTADNHDNAVAVLTGRNILCGSSSYLYYHGLDYSGMQAAARQMLTDSVFFETGKDIYGIEYVYFGPHERSIAGNIENYLRENYKTVFLSDQVKIYEINAADSLQTGDFT